MPNGPRVLRVLEDAHGWSGRVDHWGHSGFIGQSAVRTLAQAGWTVNAALRVGARLDAGVEKIGHS